MRTLATRALAELMETGVTLEAGMEAILERLGAEFEADVGLIAVDRRGHAVARHRTRDMPHAFFSGNSEIVARMRV